MLTAPPLRPTTRIHNNFISLFKFKSENHLKICIHSARLFLSLANIFNSFAFPKLERISIEIGEILIIEFIAFQLYD